MRTVSMCLVAATLGLLLLAPPVLADGDLESWQRKIEEARRQIEVLLRKGRELEGVGRVEQAKDLFARAKKMEVAVRRALEQAERKSNHDRRREPNDRARLLGEVEQGIHALRALGHEGAANQVRRILQDVLIAERQRENDVADDREVWARRAKVMKLAVHGLAEIDRPDLAHRLEHGVHALELAAEGRNDEEAKSIRRTAPRLAEMRGLVVQGLEAWRKLGDADRAAELEALLVELRGRAAKAAQKQRRRDRDVRAQRDAGAARERKAAARQIEVYHLAMKAMDEAERPKEMDVLERAARVLKVGLEGRRGKEAQATREAGPSREQIVEVLRYASRLYDGWGHRGPSVACRELADKLQRVPAAEDPAAEDHAAGDAVRLDEIEVRLRQLMQAMERLGDDLEKMGR